MSDKQEGGFFHFAAAALSSAFKALTRDANELERRRALGAAKEQARAFVQAALPDSAMPKKAYDGEAYSGSYPAMEFKSVQKGLVELLAIRGLALAQGGEDPIKGCESWDHLAERLEGSSMGSSLRSARWAFREALDGERYGVGMRWTHVARDAFSSVQELAFDRFLQAGEACAAAAQRELIAQSVASTAPGASAPRAKSRSL